MKHIRIITVAVLIGILLPQFSGATWYNVSWGNKRSITIPATSVNETLVNFPVYLNLADFTDLSNASTTGYDFRVLNSAEDTVLNHELVAASTTAPTGELYFKAPSLSSSTANVFYLYYNNDSAPDISTSSAFNSDYVYVGHFEATSSDSTVNDNDIATVGATATTTGAKIGQAYAFNGSNQYIESNIVIVDAYPFSFSVWANQNSGSGDDVAVFAGDKDVENAYVFLQSINGAGTCTARNTTNYDVGSGVTYEDTYQYITCAYRSATDREVYINGTSKATGADSVTVPAIDRTGVGRNGRATPTTYWNGELDEVRISTAVASTSWVLAEYANMATTTDFYTIGSQESQVTDNIGGIRMGFNF